MFKCFAERAEIMHPNDPSSDSGDQPDPEPQISGTVFNSGQRVDRRVHYCDVLVRISRPAVRQHRAVRS